MDHNGITLLYRRLNRNTTWSLDIKDRSQLFKRKVTADLKGFLDTLQKWWIISQTTQNLTESPSWSLLKFSTRESKLTSLRLTRQETEHLLWNVLILKDNVKRRFVPFFRVRDLIVTRSRKIVFLESSRLLESIVFCDKAGSVCWRFWFEFI